MNKKSIKDIPSLFKYVDFLVITDNKGYIQYYNIFNSKGTRIVEDPVGLHILELHQHLNDETSTIMTVLRNKEPVINEKQYLNIFKERTVTVLSTTFPLISGNEVIGAMEINSYIDEDQTTFGDDSSESQDNNYFFTIDDIITQNPRMIEIKNKALKAAKTNSPVMIYGETGTGKDLIAHAIHNHSFRRDKPFIVQNCSAIPSSLGESILFGTTKGSFTGAENKGGIFDLANNGTLVLDELNSININLQSKLLRVTENSSFRRVGGSKLINVDVKLISILNENPYTVLEENKLRHDLFYRLGVVLIYIPPLRERKEDIPLLVDFFIKEYNNKMEKNIKGVTKHVMEFFMDYNWPGNVRELKHLIEGAFNFTENDIIDKVDLPYHVTSFNKKSNGFIMEENFDLNKTLTDYEIKYIKLALENSSTLSEAAKLLKLSRQTLKYKIDSYGISMDHH